MDSKDNPHKDDTKNSTPNSYWFNIGKSFGLTTDRKAIDAYYTAVGKSIDSLKEKRDAELDDLRAQSDSVKTTLDGLAGAIEKDMTFILNRSSELLKNFKSVVDELAENREDLKEKANAQYNLGFERLQKHQKGALSIEAEISAKIKAFYSSIDGLTDRAIEEHDTFIRELQHTHPNFPALEEGFLYGQALKAAEGDAKANNAL